MFVHLLLLVLGRVNTGVHCYACMTMAWFHLISVGLSKQLNYITYYWYLAVICRSRKASFPDYQDINTLWTFVFTYLLSVSENVGLFMVGLLRLHCTPINF